MRVCTTSSNVTQLLITPFWNFEAIVLSHVIFEYRNENYSTTQGGKHEIILQYFSYKISRASPLGNKRAND